MTKKIAAKDAASIHSFRLDPISKKWEVDPALNERYKWIKKYLDLPEKYNPRLVEIIKRESSKGKKMLIPMFATNLAFFTVERTPYDIGYILRLTAH